MRWPIQVQLLLPMLSVVVLAIVLASAAGAYFGGLRARRQQEENLNRVVTTLAEATFPLTDRVLGQMSGLSGAEFVLVDDQQSVRSSTFPLDAPEQQVIHQVQGDPSGQWAEGSLVTLGGRNYLAKRVPVARRSPALGPGWLIVLYPEDRWRATPREAAYPALVAGGVAVLAVVLVTTLLAQRFVRPVRRLGDHAAAIASGDFQPIAVPERDDEIRDLSLSINRMGQQLGRYESEVRRSERLRTLEQLAAGMAHQFRNAAAGARLAIELHEQQCPLGADCETLQVAMRQLRLIESYLQRFLSLGSAGAAPRQEVALGGLVEDVLALVRPACSHAGIELSLAQPAEAVRIRGDPESLRQLVVNLALNGMEAAARSGAAARRVAVRVERRGADRVLLRVEDTGPGPSPEVAPRLFEPFVTDKPDGTGLGLSVARQIAEAHGASIGWDRRGGMTCFTVDFPCEGK